VVNCRQCRSVRHHWVYSSWRGLGSIPDRGVFLCRPPPSPRTQWRSVLFNFYAFHHVYLLLTSGMSGIYLHDALFQTHLHTLCPVITLQSRLSRRIITDLLQVISIKCLGTWFVLICVLSSFRDWLFLRFGGTHCLLFQCDWIGSVEVKQQWGGRKCVVYIALFEGIGLRDDGNNMFLRNLGASNRHAMQKHQLRPLLAQKPLWQTEHLRINSYFIPPPLFWPS
jgi:hypothetical protein